VGDTRRLPFLLLLIAATVTAAAATPARLVAVPVLDTARLDELAARGALTWGADDEWQYLDPASVPALPPGARELRLDPARPAYFGWAGLEAPAPGSSGSKPTAPNPRSPAASFFSAEPRACVPLSPAARAATTGPR